MQFELLELRRCLHELSQKSHETALLVFSSPPPIPSTPKTQINICLVKSCRRGLALLKPLVVGVILTEDLEEVEKATV